MRWILRVHTYKYHYYRPQGSCEGYFFTGVCLSTGGCLLLGGAWSWGGVCSWGDAWSRGVCLLPEGCLVQGGAWSWGVPGPRGVCSGGCLVPRVCSQGGWYPSMHWGRHPGETATAVDGTHPTGMHSCNYNTFTSKCMLKRFQEIPRARFHETY